MIPALPIVRYALVWLAPMLSLVVASASARAEPPAVEFALYARQYGGTVLTRSVQTAHRDFVIDAVSELTIRITSLSANLVPSVLTPAGQTITSDNIHMFPGAEFEHAKGLSAPGPGIFMYGADSTPGDKYIFRLPGSMTPGTFRVMVTDTTVTGPSLVFMEIELDSAKQAALIAVKPIAVSSHSNTLVVAVFDGDQPVVGAQVTATVFPPAGEPYEVTLVDVGPPDGGGFNGDWEADDGLYSVLLPPSQFASPGSYDVLGRVRKFAEDGQTVVFERHVATTVQVVTQAAALTASPVSSFARDDDADGCPDRLVLSVPLVVGTAGVFQLQATLRAASGSELLAVGRGNLSAGPVVFEAEVPGDEIVTFAESGPYEVVHVALWYNSGEGYVPSDEVYGSLGVTPSFDVSDFDCPKRLAFTRLIAAEPFDDEPDGMHDGIEISLGLSTTVPGEYAWSLWLLAECGAPLAGVSGLVQLLGGVPEEVVSGLFPAHTFAGEGLDGAYRLVDLHVTGPGGSIFESVVGVTGALYAWEFSGYQTPRDCNGDGLADRCQVEENPGLDRDYNGILDACECRADVNGDGYLDVSDIFTFLSLWFGGDPLADFNSSGMLEVQDILAFLQAWFSGC